MDDNQVDAFFAEFIDGFMWGDVERCIKQRANLVVALALLSYTEVLGGLHNGKLGIEGASAECFREALGLMTFNGDKNYYRDFRVRLTDENGTTTDADAYKVFRCGLAHEYFAKSLATVANNDQHANPRACKADAPGFGWMPIKDVVGERLALFTNAYYRDLRTAFDDLRGRVKAGGQARTLFETAAGRIMSRSAAKK